MEEHQLFGALTVYRERGAHLRRLEQFQKSNAAYDQALKTNPQDVRTLIGRSQVSSDAMKPVQAFNDAELALTLEPNNMAANNMRARALYTMSDFERSVVMNHRGLRKRRQPPYFMEGISQGVVTIEDCVGLNAGKVMLDFLPLIKHKEFSGDEDEMQKPVHVSRIPKPEFKKKLTQMEAQKLEILARVLAMKYLGPMAYDKFFLQGLTRDLSIQSANAEGSHRLKELVHQTLQTLSERQEMLRAQRPYYTVKLAEKTTSAYQTKYMQKVLIKEREINTHTAERMVKQIEKSMRELRIMDVMAKAERMQIFLDMRTHRTLPDKKLFIDRLYKAVGDGYLVQHRLSYRFSERGNRRRVAFLMGLQTSRPTSYDSVMANYPYKFVEPKYAMEKVMSTLETCENSMMRCWLMYELARLLFSQKNFALGKFYAKRCQKEAQGIDCTTWWLNGCFALISGDMQQGNINEVRAVVDTAIEFTKKMQDPEKLHSFLLKCAEMVTETQPSDVSKEIKLRENQILSVIDPDLVTDTEVLFKRISRVPVGRRTAVLPTKAEYTKPVRRKDKQRGLTIIPGPEKALPELPKSKVLGFQQFT